MARDSFSSFSPMVEEPESKYSNYDVGALEQKAQPPQQNAPSSPQGGAASQGALGNPDSSGGTPAFSPAKKGQGEAAKPVSDFHRMYLEGDESERESVAEKMEAQFAEQGLSLQGAVNKVFEQGGEAAMGLAEKFGYVPPEEKAGQGAFKTREEALKDYGVEMDEAKEQKLAAEKKAKNRHAMGGFLMDVGLRILASNREDGGGAIGEGVLGAQQSRRDTKRQDAADTMAAEDRTRKQSREDESDAMARQREARQVEESEYKKGRRGAQEEKEAREGLAQITDKEGLVQYVKIEEGLITDKEGVPIRKATAKEVSAAQEQTNIRQREGQFQKERGNIQKIVDEGFETEDSELNAIIAETDGDIRREMIADLAKKRIDSGTSSEETVNYIDY